METNAIVKASAIEANDMIEAVSQHNFPSQFQVIILKFIDFVLFKKQNPEDTCGIIERKIKLLELSIETTEKENIEKSGIKRTLKVTTDVLMALLKKAGISAASDDKAKIARLISYLTNFSEEKIRQRLSNTDELVSYHREEVENINKIFKELNSDISIQYNNKL